MTDAVRWLVLIEVIGLAAIPITSLVLGRLPGGGLGVAKPLGLLICTSAVWLGAAVRVVPYGTGSAVAGVVLLALLGVGAHLAGRPRRGHRLGAQRALRRRLAVSAEAVFVVAFVAMALLTAYAPDVWSTEKPMDMAIVNATNESRFFPPHDPWLAGADLNYYYLGHLMAAMMVRLTGVAPEVGYNLAVALFYALAATAVFTVAASLRAAMGAGARWGPVRVGLVAVALALVVGNLDGATALWDGRPLSGFAWFAPSRAIPDTITEFPYFSFLLGDLHAHLLAVPFTCLALCFALQTALKGPRLRLDLRGVAELAAIALTIGALYAINSWSFPVGAGVMVLAVAVWLRDPASEGRRRGAVLWTLAMVAGAVLLFLPFHLHYDPATSGVAAVRRHRSFTHFVRDQALVYGLFWLILAAPFAGAVLRTRKPLRNAVWGAVVALVIGSVLAERNAAGLAVLTTALIVALRAMLAPATRPPMRFVWLLVAAGLACIALPEAVYVRDTFDGGPLYRMNTVFKLGFQAWLLLAVAGACLLADGRRWLPAWPRRGWTVAVAGVLALALVYPYAGTYARNGGFSRDPTLNGLGWLTRQAPGDVEAIGWLRRNAPPDAVVLEAAGDDYSPAGHARISTFTGRPTIIGWGGHEVQWKQRPGVRRIEVARLYGARGAAAAEPLLRRYGVRYVVVGPLERSTYGTAGLSKWDALGRRVFDGRGTTVWAVRSSRGT
jgi:YYY domain-containing protein